MFIDPEVWRPQGVHDLEPRAWEALRETSRSVCVTAGAGAGKTEFLAQKATYLLQTSICPEPKRILAISFKRDAAQNLAARVRKRCPREQARRFQSMTFDALTKHLLDHFRLALPEEFRPPADYWIAFPSRHDFDDFLERHKRPDIDRRRFEKDIARTSLPLTNPELTVTKRRLLQAYWKEQLDKPTGVALSFSMINRLVEYMLRINPYIKKAFQKTFPFVFLDEFQDTTCAQYELVLTAFSNSETKFTAVGDDKQKIMIWAGAMENAFRKFISDFDAVEKAFILNWRSHEELVSIQRVIAARIDPDFEEVEARATCTVNGQVAAIWRFANRQQEAEQIASWIKAEVEAGNVEPHDIAILVRMKADDVEKELEPVFTKRNLKLRNLARNVGEISIQDLLAEEITSVILSILRLSASKRNPAAWTNTYDKLQYILGIDPDDDYTQARLINGIEDLLRSLRNKMSVHSDKMLADDIIQNIIHFVGADNIQQAFVAYRRKSDYDRVLNGFKLLLQECIEECNNWLDTLDRFEGFGQVPLMTIHKSKGLEFHTMIFFGLDTNTWWSLSPDQKEELNSFYVAFTRARQRAFFSYCSQRGDSIKWLEHLLVPAGVEEVDCCE